MKMNFAYPIFINGTVRGIHYPRNIFCLRTIDKDVPEIPVSEAPIAIEPKNDKSSFMMHRFGTQIRFYNGSYYEVVSTAENIKESLWEISKDIFSDIYYSFSKIVYEKDFERIGLPNTSDFPVLSDHYSAHFMAVDDQKMAERLLKYGATIKINPDYENTILQWEDKIAKKLDDLIITDGHVWRKIEAPLLKFDFTFTDKDDKRFRQYLEPDIYDSERRWWDTSYKNRYEETDALYIPLDFAHMNSKELLKDYTMIEGGELDFKFIIPSQTTAKLEVLRLLRALSSEIIKSINEEKRLDDNVIYLNAPSNLMKQVFRANNVAENISEYDLDILTSEFSEAVRDSSQFLTDLTRPLDTEKLLILDAAHKILHSHNVNLNFLEAVI